MAEGNISKLPKLGEITLPVHLMIYDDKKNKNKKFHSNFCFWKAADGSSVVTNNDGKEIGTIGGTMGGHVEVNRYYPEHENYEQWINVIIDVRDIWNQIEQLLDTPGANVIIEGLEEIHEKYQALKSKEKKTDDEKKAKLDEIRQMQKDAEDEKKKKIELEKIINDLAKAKENAEEVSRILKIAQEDAEKKVKVKYWINKTGVIEDGGWDLTKKIDTSDHCYSDEEDFKDKIIPKNYGTGIRIIDDEGKILVSPKPGEYPEVELRISTWMGVSPGAIHYYGTLNFAGYWLYYEDKPTCSSSSWDIKICERSKIEITHALEAWELRDYPDSYKCWRVGDYYRGFYTAAEVIKAGKKFFKKYFEKGWKLKITEL